MANTALHSKQSRASKVGFLLASASAPRSFQRSLMERDSIDQGIVTGLTMAITYVLGSLTQDGLEIVSNKITKSDPNSKKLKNESIRDPSDIVSFWLSVGAIGAGIVTQKIFKQRKSESMVNASVRTSGHILARVGVAGVVSQGLEKSANKIAKGKNARQSELVYSMIVPSGMLLAVIADRVKYSDTTLKDEGNSSVNKLKSIGIGIGLVGLLGGMSFAERKTAKGINNTVDKYAPSLNRSWLPIGHLISTGLLVSAVGLGLKKLYSNIEHGSEKLENNFRKTPSSIFVSGSKQSIVPWKTLSVEGRRHIGTRLNNKHISQVMNCKLEDVKEPIRVYVGLDSARNEQDRVLMALQELIRTNAYKRKYIVIISPTGSGYVNYVMSDTVEYMSKGDCAQVTLQYSKRPSPLSLDRRDEGYVQYRMLINGIKKELLKITPIKRPVLVLFGESLGAWTSQDAFMFEGTDGFEANLINKALWIGTPAESKWKERTLSGKTLNTESNKIGVFNSFEEYKKLPTSNQRKIQYFMITHYNDPVARFTTSLLVQAPDWLISDSERLPTIPKSNHFRVPGTFVQTLVDMKNALKPIPGQFVATGHDYRGDLAPFIKDIFEFKITEQQYEDVLKALKSNDKARAKKT